MKSAATIRVCSKIIMVITVIAAIIGGLVLAMECFDVPVLAILSLLLVWGVGIFAAIFQNALFQGFADIIDNSHVVAEEAGEFGNSIREKNGQ